MSKHSISRALNNISFLSKAIRCALITGVCATPALVHAAEAETDQTREIEVIEVTAERRVGNLQTTPIAVTAMSQETLTEHSIVDVTDLTGFVPSLVVSGQEDQSDIKVYIRGVGTNNPTETGDQGVGVYVDGVYAARAQGALALMYDLEGIQVLRGPQGTLFGRNNTGGALLLDTKKPGEDFEGDFQMTYGNYNRQQMSGGVTIPVSGNLSFRLAGYIERDDGWVNAIDTDPRGSEHNYSGFDIGRVADTNTKLNNTDVRSARLTGLWNISDDLTWTASFETFSDQGNHGILLNPVLVEQDNFDAFIDSPVSLDLTSDVWRSTLSYDITDGINIEYIAGFSQLDRHQVVDQDAGVTSRFQEGRTEYQYSDASSHEIKIQNTDGGPLSWTTGLYYFEEETNIRFDFDGQGSWLQGGNTFIQPARGAESKAAFLQLGYRLTDELTLTGGVRYTDDLKYDRGGRNIQDCNNEFIRPTLGGSQLSVFEDFLNNTTGMEGADGLDDYTGLERTRNQCAATLRNDIEDESSKTTYLLRADYQMKDHLVYASVGTGYRAGVIQDGGQSTKPENSTSYEIGSKSDISTKYGDVRVNLAAFFIDYEDLIRSGFDEDKNQIVNSNVAAAEIKGIEAEVTWLFGEAGRLDFSGSYLDASYTDYVSDNGGDNPGNALITEGPEAGLYDLSGNTLPQSPELQFSANLSWAFSTDHGDYIPRLNVRYVDDVYFTDQNQVSSAINNMINDVEQTGTYYGNDAAGQKAHTKANLGMKFYPAEGDWSLDLYINNVTDKMTRSSVSFDNGTAAGNPGRYAPPRTFGIRFNTSF
ncbi:TonB-dependent receptor [Thalassomonas sp. RHCl1]|uniref:TonB-dependent receptor n=1 Tax=Thalassomonas sp. RHCl1 TaxID=2995320 RepID=UPI00248C2951|nr:TonB-dependent receptor [Thalassomonas sp. RHCl1]